MTKQEFLAISLPYGLKLKSDPLFEDDRIYDFNGFEINEGLIHISENEEYWHNEHVYLPILHPLSDLTKEIEHKGEKFVPIEEILNYPLSYYDDKEDALMSIQNYTAQIRWWTVQILIEWHFDISGLIEKNEAIDVNTLTENPYK